MGKVTNTEAQKHTKGTSKPLDMNKILEIYPVLNKKAQGDIPTTNVCVVSCLNHV